MRRPPARTTTSAACAAPAMSRSSPKMRIFMMKAYITRMRRLALLAALLLAGCATAASRGPVDLARAEIVDLTYPFDARTLYWPNSPGGFEIKELAHGMTPGGYFYASNSFCAPE